MRGSQTSSEQPPLRRTSVPVSAIATVPRAALCPSPGLWASALSLPPTGPPWAAQGGGSVLRARPATALTGSVSMRSRVPSYS